jgi:hypothetical protein
MRLDVKLERYVALFFASRHFHEQLYLVWKRLRTPRIYRTQASDLGAFGLVLVSDDKTSRVRSFWGYNTYPP